MKFFLKGERCNCLKTKSSLSLICSHSKQRHLPTKQGWPAQKRWLTFSSSVYRMVGGFPDIEFSHSACRLWTVVVSNKKDPGFLRMEMGRKIFYSLLKHLWYFIYSYCLLSDQAAFLCCIFGSLGLFYFLPFFNVSLMFNLNHLPFIFLSISSYFSFLTFVLFLPHWI